MSIDRRTILVAAAATVALPKAVSATATAGAAVKPARPAPFAAPTSGVQLDPRSFGAKGDGTTKDTMALQRALDRCAVLGGGTVAVAGGRYLTGALEIGSNTVLRIEAGAALLGSPDLADYPVTEIRWEGRWVPGHIGLIHARSARNIGLTGKGSIIASDAIPGRVAADGLRHPALLEFVDVAGLSVTELTTRQNDMWSIHPVYCEDALFRDLVVKGRADGIDVDSCRRVAIERCDFDTVDDCISLKSGRGMEGNRIARPTEDVSIADCTFRDHRWACIGIGSETSGGIRRVTVQRCRFLKAHTFSVYIKSRPGRGAFIEDIAMRDLEVSGAGNGFLRLNFLDSGKQDQFPVPGRDGIPTVRNFRFERIRVTDVPVLVEAVNIHPDKPLDGFVLSDVTGTADKGMRLANIRGAVLQRIDVKIAEGAKLATANVSGRGLEGADLLTPPPLPDPVVAGADYRLGMESGRPN
ncbi:polygalacturonase [Sphingomonas zeicaulis]|uniref:glycoside hydrolase family 28 protein n=1 Tax=Sphingomonas zeicaulis TaxID=1632740 RepID=UPI003D210727